MEMRSSGKGGRENTQREWFFAQGGFLGFFGSVLTPDDRNGRNAAGQLPSYNHLITNASLSIYHSLP